MNRLREVRKKQGLTLKELSQQLKNTGFNISPDTLGKYERAEREPKLETWQKLANFFNVSVPYLQGIKTYSNDDIFKIIQYGYKHGKEPHVKRKNGVLNFDLSDLQIKSEIEQLILVRSVNNYLKNKKQGAKPLKIKISENEVNNLTFWENNFNFILKNPSVRLLLKTEKQEEKENIKRIIANAISLETMQEEKQFLPTEFFNGILDFIKAKEITTKVDENNLSNISLLTMFDVLNKLDKNK